MKKLFIPLSFCLLTIGSVMAQDNQGVQTRKHGEGKHQMMAEKLNLSADQKEKMKTINQDFKKQADALKSNDGMTLGDFKGKMKTLKEQRKSQVNNILTDEQKAKMKEGKQHKMKGNAKARFQKLNTELQLTTDQQALLKAKQKEFGNQAKTIRQNQDLSEDAKKTQLAAIKKQRADYLKSILTQQQVQKLETLKNTKK